MKRIIALLLSVLLCVFSIPLSVFAATETDKNTQSIEAFSRKLLSVAREYDKKNSNIADESLNLDGDDYEYAEDDELMKVFNSEAQVAEDNSSANFSSDGKTITSYASQMENEAYITPDVLKALGFSESAEEAVAKALVENALRSRRLIVKSEKDIKDETAEQCVSGYKDLYIFQYKDIESTVNAFKTFLNNNEIKYVEPDYIYTMQGVQAQVDLSAEQDAVADTQNNVGSVISSAFSFHQTALSWVSESIGFESIKESLAQKALKEVKVAVLDSGVDTDHELLKDRLILSNCNLSTTGEENSCEDDFGHGTHVAGIVADNTLSNVKIEPYKVLNNQGNGSLSLIAIAVDLAVADGADVINMSLTSKGTSQTLEDSVNAAYESGTTVVVAAGNYSDDIGVNNYSPACIKSAVTVASVSKYNTLSAFSNYGDAVDIAAPGEKVKSSGLNNTYMLMSGTSMASPLVAAGAAIIKSAFPDFTNGQVEERLEKYSSKINADSTGKKFGSGILFLKYILQEMPRVAEPVFSVTNPEFSEQFRLTLTCPEEGATIVYLLNSDVATPEIGILKGTTYHDPLVISTSTKVTAVAIATGKLPSSLVTYEYERVIIDENSLYDINSAGLITGYYGHSANVVIPDKVRGVTVTGIGSNVFKENDEIVTVTLPDTAVSIGSYAFAECTSLESVTGSNITTIYSNAFQNSTIQKITWDKVNMIAAYAFSGCSDITDPDLSSVGILGQSAFENAQGIKDVYMPNLLSAGAQAFSNSDITSAVFDKATVIGKGAFDNCLSLKSVEIPNVKTINDNTFKNCINLSEITLPQVTSIGNFSFMNTALTSISFENVAKVGIQAFLGVSNASYASLPKATSIQHDAFANCTSLEYIYVPSLTVLTANSFKNCPKLIHLYLPKVTKVESAAFNGSSVTIIMFEKANTILSLPETLKAVMLPSSLKTVSINEEITAEVYGTSGTTAETFADSKNLVFNPIPAIIYEVSDEFRLEDEFLYVLSVGFNNTYQWFISSDGTNQNGTAIDGATDLYYTPLRSDNAPYYYCEITSTDGQLINKTVTPVIKNDLRLQNADYTEYNKAVAFAKTFDSELYVNYSDLEVLLSENISEKTKAEQSDVDLQTENILNTIKKLNYKNADYEAYNNAVKSANEKDGNLYSNFSILLDALGVDVSGKNITQQNIVDEQTATILNAINTLAYKSADYTAYNKAVETAKGIDKDLYTNYSILLDALGVDVSGKNITQQNIVDEQTAAILNAINTLTYKSADYTAYDKAVATAKGIDKDLYTNYSILLDALGVDVSGKNITQQNIVDEQTAAILNAISALTYKSADYTSYDKAVETANGIDKELYTNYSILLNALSVDVSGKNITQQNIVDEQTATILNAISALTYKGADYTEIDGIINRIPLDLSEYTEESVARLRELLNRIDRSELITDQNEVDNLAEEIAKAVSLLKLKQDTPETTNPVKDPPVSVPETTTSTNNAGGTENITEGGKSDTTAKSSATTNSYEVSIPKTGGFDLTVTAFALALISSGIIIAKKSKKDSDD